MDDVGLYLRAFLSNRGTDEELRRLIAHFADSAKYISEHLKGSIRDELESFNVYQERQMKLDVLADKIIANRLSEETSFGVREIASEEEGEIKNLKTKGDSTGRYSVTIDPLDGSSLIDVNLSIGTIFGIHDNSILGDGKPAREKMSAAMYFLYGPATTLVLSTGKGTHEFLLDRVGNWILKTENIILEDKGKIYSRGGLKREWSEKHSNYVDELERQGYKLRYSGALVADMNQVLIKRGGVFSYPALNKKPDGKLRLLFELQPMAFLMENAGGRATNGLDNILDIIPKKLDQRSPIYIGSRYEVEMAGDYLRRVS